MNSMCKAMLTPIWYPKLSRHAAGHHVLPCRAWNDSANVSRQIPKSWDEALAHPTLRSLALRSRRRYVPD